jgi:hypothetical protein
VQQNVSPFVYLLGVLIATAVPFGVELFKKLRFNTKSAKANEYLNMGLQAAQTAVDAVAQRIVDAAKAGNLFTKEKQAEALQYAIEVGKTQMGVAAVKGVEKATGDFNKWFSDLIEAQIKRNKLYYPPPAEPAATE